MKNVLSKHQLNAYWSWNVEETGRCDILVAGTASKHPAFVAAITPDGSVLINIGPNATRLLKIEDEGVTADILLSNTPMRLVIDYNDIIGVINRSLAVVLPLGYIPFYDVGYKSISLCRQVVLESPEEIEVEKPTHVPMGDNVVRATFGKKS